MRFLLALSFCLFPLTALAQSAGSGPSVGTKTPDELVAVINDARLVRLSTLALIDICGGTRGDMYCVSKFGSNDDVGTGAFEVVWTESGVYPWSMAAETIRVQAGGNAADTAAGAGARSVTVEGLDENFDLAAVTLVTAGASASAASATMFVRVFRAYVATAGAYGGDNTGTILIENTVSADVIGAIAAGQGQSELGLYTIPAGYTGYLMFVDFEVDGTKEAEVRMRHRRDADVVSAPFAPVRLVHRGLAVAGPVPWTPGVLIQFPEKTDIWIEAKGGSNSTVVNARFDLIVVASDP